MSAIERLILAYPRWRMRKSSGKQLKATMLALDECIETRRKLSQYNVPDLLKLFDSSQFCLMFQADIAILIRDTTCRLDWWECRLYGRLLAMTMFECVDDVPTVLGKDFRASLDSLGIQPPVRHRISAVTKGLSTFQKSYGVALGRIRTIAAAHRDHDAGLQATVIEDIDIKDLMKLAKELTDLLSSFVLAMNDVLREVSVFNEITKSLLKKSV